MTTKTALRWSRAQRHMHAPGRFPFLPLPGGSKGEGGVTRPRLLLEEVRGETSIK